MLRTAIALLALASGLGLDLKGSEQTSGGVPFPGLPGDLGMRIAVVPGWNGPGKAMVKQKGLQRAGVRDEDEAPKRTAAPTTAAPTTAAPTTAAATTAAATTAAPGECTDDDAGVSEASGGVLPDCASGVADGFCSDTTFLGLCCAACTGSDSTSTLPPDCADSDAGVKKATKGQVEDCEMGYAMGLCTDATFSEHCCASCGGHTGTTPGPCVDDNEGVELGTGGQLPDCQAAVDIGACVDAAFQEVCCLSCRSAGGAAQPATTAAPLLTTVAESDPALAAVSAATKVADEKKEEAKIAMAAAEASEEVAVAARQAATEAMQALKDHEKALHETATTSTTSFYEYDTAPEMHKLAKTHKTK